MFAKIKSHTCEITLRRAVEYWWSLVASVSLFKANLGHKEGAAMPLSWLIASACLPGVTVEGLPIASATRFILSITDISVRWTLVPKWRDLQPWCWMLLTKASCKMCWESWFLSSLWINSRVPPPCWWFQSGRNDKIRIRKVVPTGRGDRRKKKMNKEVQRQKCGWGI